MLSIFVFMFMMGIGQFSSLVLVSMYCWLHRLNWKIFPHLKFSRQVHVELAISSLNVIEFC